MRKLVKLFNVDEYQVQEDLDELQKKINQVRWRTDQDDMDRQEEVHPIEENQEGDYYDEDTGYIGVDEDQQIEVEVTETEDVAEQPGGIADEEN